MRRHSRQVLHVPSKGSCKNLWGNTSSEGASSAGGTYGTIAPSSAVTRPEKSRHRATERSETTDAQSEISPSCSMSGISTSMSMSSSKCFVCGWSKQAEHPYNPVLRPRCRDAAPKLISVHITFLGEINPPAAVLKIRKRVNLAVRLVTLIKKLFSTRPWEALLEITPWTIVCYHIIIIQR